MHAASPSQSTGCKPVPFSRRWLRRLLWACVCLVSLLTVYYQWENRRGARELKDARKQLIARIGTDDPITFAPPAIQDEQNYFSLPVIEQWATRPLDGDNRFKAYDIPKGTFLPFGFVRPQLIENEAGLPETVDWSSWAKNRDLKGESAAVAMNREMGDANGLLPRLASGLTRPFACVKPGLREAFEATEGQIYQAIIPNIRHLNEHTKDISLHLRAAAHAGEMDKARKTALISLRLFPESFAAHGTLVSALQSTASHNIVFDALHDALSCPVWDERSLSLIQAQLAKDHDVRIIEQALMRETLWVHAIFVQARQKRAALQPDAMLESFSVREACDWWDHTYAWILRLGPIGWLDSDNAAYIHRMLETIGPDSETTWIDAAERYRVVRQRVADESKACMPLPNVRRFCSSIAYPNIGSLYSTAAETLFRRRCLILACELEKHRLRHGAYPATLPVLSGFDTQDPAAPSKQPGYKLEATGYVLTSAQGWQWRMKRTL